MPLPSYGLLKGTPVGHLRDADDDHYQILVARRPRPARKCTAWR